MLRSGCYSIHIRTNVRTYRVEHLLKHRTLENESMYGSRTSMHHGLKICIVSNFPVLNHITKYLSLNRKKIK